MSTRRTLRIVIAAVVAALMYQPLSAQFNPGGLGKALKDKAKAKDQQKKDEQEKVPAKSLEGPGVYFPVSQSAPFYYVVITGLGTDTIALKQYKEAASVEPSADILLTRMSDSIYNWHNILENDENKQLVIHPDGLLSLIKFGKDYGSYNWIHTLSTKESERGTFSTEKHRPYVDYAERKGKDAYLAVRGALVAERAKRISPLVKKIAPADDDAAALKMCESAHTKLFRSPDFNVPGLTFVKAMSARADWKIVRNEITGNPMYRVKDFVVIAKNPTSGQHYVLYSSVTQEFAGDWQEARCSTSDEAGGFYLLGDDKLQWGIVHEIDY